MQTPEMALWKVAASHGCMEDMALRYIGVL